MDEFGRPFLKRKSLSKRGASTSTQSRISAFAHYKQTLEWGINNNKEGKKDIDPKGDLWSYIRSGWLSEPFRTTTGKE